MLRLWDPGWVVTRRRSSKLSASACTSVGHAQAVPEADAQGIASKVHIAFNNTRPTAILQCAVTRCHR
jgi:hypothetical protein